MPKPGKKRKGAKAAKSPRIAPDSVTEKKVISKEEAKVIEEKNLYWQDMFRQAVFLDMNHSYNRPWVISYFRCVPRKAYNIQIGSEEEGQDKKKGKGKKKKK